MSGMVRGKQESAEVLRKSERVRESKEPKSTEGSENSSRIVAPAGESEMGRMA